MTTMQEISEGVLVGADDAAAQEMHDTDPTVGIICTLDDADQCSFERAFHLTDPEAIAARIDAFRADGSRVLVHGDPAAAEHWLQRQS